MNKPNPPEAYFGLPQEVTYCKKCIMSNQRPSSYPEFRHTTKRKTPSLNIWSDGVCDACRYAEKKAQIDWAERERELLKVLDAHRRADGGYDCVVPGSGGKDSCFAAHVLKYKYKMNPLTVTWPPILYTDVGLQNFRNWIEVGGFDNITFKPNGKAQKLLTRLSIENLFHPFHTFILGQKNLAPKMAIKFDIPLVFFGESEAEYGSAIAESKTSKRNPVYFSMNNLSEIYLGGVSIPELMEKHGLTLNELSPYFPPSQQELEEKKIEVHYLGYYLKWTPQEAYYYAVENTGFKANPSRTEGTYSKYNSLDDKIDGFHYYTTWIKFGLGRATYDASQEIRNKHITREEAILLAKRFDGEFPERHYKEVMDYIGMEPERFMALQDQFRSPHLWKQDGNQWVLRRPVWHDD